MERTPKYLNVKTNGTIDRGTYSNIKYRVVALQVRKLAYVLCALYNMYIYNVIWEEQQRNCWSYVPNHPSLGQGRLYNITCLNFTYFYVRLSKVYDEMPRSVKDRALQWLAKDENSHMWKNVKTRDVVKSTRSRLYINRDN